MLYRNYKDIKPPFTKLEELFINSFKHVKADPNKIGIKLEVKLTYSGILIKEGYVDGYESTLLLDNYMLDLIYDSDQNEAFKCYEEVEKFINTRKLDLFTNEYTENVI